MPPLATILRRAPWLVPVLAVCLAGLSALLGQLGYDRVLAEPEERISFIVDGDLPHGITQETVDAAATQRALSYEPFTVLVVGRELTWDEHQHGEFPDDVDVMLSVGFDEADPDLVLADARRVSLRTLAGQEDWMPHHRVATDVRETFLNNLTQGQGPGAVVGAALTAGSAVYDGGTRSPAFWGAAAGLPLLVALLMTLMWWRFLRHERARQRDFSRARRRLAHVLLELDLLEVHYLVAASELDQVAERGAKAVANDVGTRLHDDWSAIRDESLRLARAEQVLTRELIDPRAPVHESRTPSEPMTLPAFATAADALRRRADALAAASSLRLGHTDGRTVLGRVALPSTQAVEEILRHGDLLPVREAKELERRRRALLALVQERESAPGAESGQEVVVRHADLMGRWRREEQRLVGALEKTGRALEKGLSRSDRRTRDVDGEATRRHRDRVRAATGGQMDTLDELRGSLGLSQPARRTPSWTAERVLVLLARTEATTALDEGHTSETVTVRPDGWTASWAARMTGPALVTVPIIAALVSGWVAVATMDGQNTAFGRVLTGDQPVAALHVAGDLALVPDHVDPPAYLEERNVETLTLEYVREQMVDNTAAGDRALLPERLELIVALLPLDDYVATRPAEEGENRLEVDYSDLLHAYPRIKDEAAAVQPAAIDTVTGDVRPGYAILPLWLGTDGRFAAGLPMTGYLSWGVDSRLGAYDFNATELAMRNSPGDAYSLPVGSEVASTLTDLGTEMEYNQQRAAGISASTLFWMVAIAVWTGVQAVALAALSLLEAVRRTVGTGRTRGELRAMRKTLNGLALGLDLSRLDAVAVLGGSDNPDKQEREVAEIDQHLYETVLLTAWRDVEELEQTPRREQRTSEWRARVERLRRVIDSLGERETDVAERALTLIRSYA